MMSLNNVQPVQSVKNMLKLIGCFLFGSSGNVSCNCKFGTNNKVGRWERPPLTATLVFQKNDYNLTRCLFVASLSQSLRFFSQSTQ